ncbi:hypothetical protein Syun_022385 [Stephania yunnanensis]|uniref:DOC domain-containing protein n=1 Tax=Stephania yunnanensis TaxID=152371 RepID=A0AAP0FKD6_9MAGN
MPSLLREHGHRWPRFRDHGHLHQILVVLFCLFNVHTEIYDLREMAKKAAWSVSSCKSGNGVQFLRDDNLETYLARLFLDAHLWSSRGFQVDESYTPSKISIRAGDGFHNLKGYALVHGLIMVREPSDFLLVIDMRQQSRKEWVIVSSTTSTICSCDVDQISIEIMEEMEKCKDSASLKRQTLRSCAFLLSSSLLFSLPPVFPILLAICCIHFVVCWDVGTVVTWRNFSKRLAVLDSILCSSYTYIRYFVSIAACT